MVKPNYRKLSEIGVGPFAVLVLIEATREDARGEPEVGSNSMRDLLISTDLLVEVLEADDNTMHRPMVSELLTLIEAEDGMSRLEDDDRPDSLTTILNLHGIPHITLWDPEDELSGFDSETHVPLTSALLLQLEGCVKVGSTVYLDQCHTVEMVVMEVGGVGISPRQVIFLELVPADCVVNDTDV